MKHLLIVVHSLTGGARQMAEAACRGAAVVAGERVAPADDNSVLVTLRDAADASVADVLAADGFVFAAPETLGSLSGLMKDFFDRTYYPALERVAGRPYVALICAGSDGNGAARQLNRIATGWRLRAIAPPLIIRTGVQTVEAILARTIAAADLATCAEVGAALAAGLAVGIF